MYVHKHRAVYLAVLAHPSAEIPENARQTDADWVVFEMAVEILELVNDLFNLALTHVSGPSYPTLARAAVSFMGVYVMLKEREAQLDLPGPIREALLAKQGLFLDPASIGRVAMASFLGQHAVDVEGVPCPPDEFQARRKATRDGILDAILRTERPDPALVDIFRANLNAELDKYETLVRTHGARNGAWTLAASADWWRAAGAWAPHVAWAAQRVLCLPATTGAAL
ncbi:hypothetical protein AMAG_07133 [Allomyces macrogynus ATCC 38327]|uniref:Uncharacterized protein n=1 Tax=Allomyces macrogynus (strain ATCC 38327) TaxID=578462 RepID=A0A0L0SH85_ALLM3|nr:hypothetical protein AMAG_07133 [Allomyces macrogynus ATCC 38327]|eukprot:KNE61861.1 hypothetical protein AMAG_07133 [Allomyces macrogynus ATCC 38327]